MQKLAEVILEKDNLSAIMVALVREISTPKACIIRAEYAMSKDFHR